MAPPESVDPATRQDATSFTGPTYAEAMAEARAALGDDCLPIAAEQTFTGRLKTRPQVTVTAVPGHPGSAEPDDTAHDVGVAASDSAEFAAFLSDADAVALPGAHQEFAETDDEPDAPAAESAVAVEVPHPLPVRAVRHISRFTDVGLPEHLDRGNGSLAELISTLDLLPESRLPKTLGDRQVHIVSLEEPEDGAVIVTACIEALIDAGVDATASQVVHHVWPSGGTRTDRLDRAALAADISEQRPALTLLWATPEFDQESAYTACRTLRGAQLLLTGMSDSARPGVVLGWGAPVAFVDGRRANAELLAATLLDCTL